MQPLLFVQLEYSYLTKTSAISDAIFAAACAGGDHQTDNKTAGKTDANVQSDRDVHVSEAMHVHAESVPSTSNGAFLVASNDTIASSMFQTSLKIKRRLQTRRAKE